MSLFEVQKLNKENKQLKNKIKQLNFQLQNTKSQIQVQKTLNKKSKSDTQVLIQQIKQLKRREEQKKYEREEMENRYVNVLRKLQDEIQDRKRKYQKLEAKISPLIDHDTVRLKILNEVEGTHFIEIQQYKRKINSLKDEILQLKRQNCLLQHKVQNSKIMYQDEIRKLRNWAQKNSQPDHINQLTFQMCSDMENRLVFNYQQAKKQSEYYKEKYFTSEKKNHQKISDLERELNLLKERNR